MHMTIERATMLYAYWAEQKAQGKVRPALKGLIQYKLEEWQWFISRGASS